MHVPFTVYLYNYHEMIIFLKTNDEDLSDDDSFEECVMSDELGMYVLYCSPICTCTSVCTVAAFNV